MISTHAHSRPQCKSCRVSLMFQIMSYEELCALLGVTEHILHGADVCVKFRNEDELIMSPRRGKKASDR
jgi:hypothetical protein